MSPPSTEPERPQRLVLGVTAHGLGHLTRSCQLAVAIQRLIPNIELHVWASYPRARIAIDVKSDFRHRAVDYEPGTAQRNCFELDRDGTVRLYVDYLRRRSDRLASEQEALELGAHDAVICDVPGVLTRAASQQGLPAVLVSNFTWDWILEPILLGTDAEPVVEMLRADYASARHHVRLPFGPDLSAAPTSEIGPLVSRRAGFGREAVRRRLGMALDTGRPVVLVCPGGWDPDGWRRIRPDTRDYDLILVGDLPVDTRPGDVRLPHALPAPLRFPDLVEAADVVLAKPGYGIASECVTHRTPIVTVDRPGFRETAMLRRELAEMGPTAELSLERFFAGQWAGALDDAIGCSISWAPLAAGADRRLAEQVLGALGWL